MPNPDRVINAKPEKDFFISMLVKDIDLNDAIKDLVDNSVDGARRVRDSGSLNGLIVNLVTGSARFEIGDNCGGIPEDVAREYAFRFGRPHDAPAIKHSVGRFGVGMKRAIFKLGRKFTIKSTTPTAQFVVEEDVEAWKEREKWEFSFKKLVHRKFAKKSQGTSITVTGLHEAVKDAFSLSSFESDLVDQLASAHEESLGRGLLIRVNGRLVPRTVPVLAQSRHIKPAHRVMTFEDGHEPMEATLFAGLGKSSSDDAGWDIFCNGRLVVDSDKDLQTGWGETRGRGIPRYHPQFARFRGFAFFDCDDPAVLPWNTTKTGMDTHSPYYQAARLQMIDMMRPVIDFLNRLDAEQNADLRPLLDAVEKTHFVKLDSVKASETFLGPDIGRLPTPDMISIQYKKPRKQVELAKEVLQASSAVEVGERTFDYYYTTEVE